MGHGHPNVSQEHELHTEDSKLPGEFPVLKVLGETETAVCS